MGQTSEPISKNLEVKQCTGKFRNCVRVAKVAEQCKYCESTGFTMEKGCAWNGTWNKHEHIMWSNRVVKNDPTDCLKQCLRETACKVRLFSWTETYN